MIADRKLTTASCQQLTMAEALTPLTPPDTLAQSTAGLLRERLLGGGFAPGERLVEAEIARQLGISRGPVREALRLLQREGLVHAELNRRVRVASFSPADLDELYALRISTEALAIRATVPHLTAEDVASLHADIEEMGSLVGEDMVRWEEVHRRFHHTLVAYSGARVVRLIEQLYDHAERYRMAYHAQGPRAWSQGEAEHREIVAACEARDPAEAAAALARHLARTASSVLMQVAPDHDPVLVRSAVRAASSPEPTSRPARVAPQRSA
jgi:DNA-binding GntR family transcriptional regulator